MKNLLFELTKNQPGGIVLCEIFARDQEMDSSCAIEPCLNFQKCLTNSKFQSASSKYLSSKSLQFRQINVQHDFSCSCPMGFTGTNISVMCDTEFNLCYSNPRGQNGVSISTESSYVCVFDPDYTGRICEINLKKSKCPEANDQTIDIFNSQICKNSNYLISLEIEDDYLVFKYSLGDQINEIKIDELSVTDDKWRTITINTKAEMSFYH
ncbi:unnamed protein product [Brachionus calyciflorus]|uniref:EGF-like domain-containing protein n=1 Tax=Brachionus calyciflorus TaxID=104777 RepID=A0A814E677_9BILA|nr:unnamed protein product [Brachionus calyciflorus]